MQILGQVIIEPDNFDAISEWVKQNSVLKKTVGIELYYIKSSNNKTTPYILYGHMRYWEGWYDNYSICSIDEDMNVDFTSSNGKIDVEEFKKFLYTLDRKRKIEIINGQ